VESPIGPFFGQGWDETYPWTSLPLAASPVKGNALVSYFQMPFAKGARIEIENQADVNIRAFYFYIDYMEQENPSPNLAYFHAWYNQETTEAAPEGENEWGLLSSEVGKNPLGERNYKILETWGKGHFVGSITMSTPPPQSGMAKATICSLLTGPKSQPCTAPAQKITSIRRGVPNEKYTHPYFGYARTPDDIGWLGRTHCYRFHIDDPIFFDTSLRFTIEHGHNNYLTLEMASVAYWYLEKTHQAWIPSQARKKEN
jgi:hypothetical protein